MRVSHPAVTETFGAGVLSALFVFVQHPFGVIIVIQILKKFPASFFELKRPKSLAAIAMLLALRVVLGMFANMTLPLFGSSAKLGLSFLPIAVAGAVYGPIPAALIGALGDVISFVIQPSPLGFFPGFTISGLITGLIYGFALYKDNISLPRVIIAWAINTATVETFLNAYWLYELGMRSAPYYTYLFIRLVTQAIKAVPEVALIFAVSKLTRRIDKR